MSIRGATIREAGQHDAPELARLRWEASAEESGYSVSLEQFSRTFDTFLEGSLDSGRWAVFVAETGGKPVANVFIQQIDKVPRPGLPRAQYGWVTNVYTEAAVRGQGIGSELLSEVITWARRRELQFLVVWPSEASAPYYRRAGFAPPDDALVLDLEEDE